jgi:hypothetical protein
MDTQEPTSRALPFDLAMLTQTVCAALGRGTAALECWQARPLSASSGAATVGVYRVSGTATDHGTRLDWALMGSGNDSNVFGPQNIIMWPLDARSILSPASTPPSDRAVLERSHCG